MNSNSGLVLLSPQALKEVLSPKTHQWTIMANIKVGDFVRWWDQDVEVLEKTIVNDLIKIKVFDNVDCKEKEFCYKPTAELSVKII